MIKCVLALLGVLIAALPVVADVGPLVDVATRAKGASRVVVARVVDVRSQFTANRFGDQVIVSTAVLDVSEILKGASATMLEVEIEGGTVGDITMKVSDLPSLAPGERAVFFLDPGTRGPHVPHDRGRGIVKLTDGDRVQDSAVTLGDLRRQIRDAVGGAR